MATLRFDNPFHDLWVTEILDPGAYVRMFSPVLVSDAEALFSTGNIVLKGRQGSGKSMLLNLLDTSTRIAYARQGADYPVPSPQRHFISAGVHLTQQNASLIAARAAEIPERQRAQTLAANFADYLNALLVQDLLKSLLELRNEQTQSRDVIPEVVVNTSGGAVAALFDRLAEAETWRAVVGAGVKSLEALLRLVEDRIRAHRNFSHFNIDALPDFITTTRSPAGAPLAELATALRDSRIIPERTLVLLRIDQHEELFELERHSGLGHVFRQVINSALARRDPRVAYRIGTRHYAWDSDVAAWGSGAPLDPERDYSVVDLDAILRRNEDRRSWRFPSLVVDVLERRLVNAGFVVGANVLVHLFGRSLAPSDKAKRYVGDSPSLIRAEEGWAPEWKHYLDALWESGEPLEAKFGEAWLRQGAQQKARVPQSGHLAAARPWKNRSQWWAKERNEIALMQIAGDRRQALIWSGDRQVVDMAGSNILAFMTICKSIWATWQRRNPREADKRGTLPNFAVEDQAIGIQEASLIWFKKIQVGLEADRRARLISALGGWFRRRMLEDRALSNPGHSGFSLLATDLTDKSDLMATIKSCRDHGDLLESVHTTRNKDQAPRVKWYLHPLLCPLFRIPYARTKEPIYTTLSEVQQIFMSQSRASLVDEEGGRHPEQAQLSLPGL